MGERRTRSEVFHLNGEDLVAKIKELIARETSIESPSRTKKGRP
jgi:hypothetical protein